MSVKKALPLKQTDEPLVAEDPEETSGDDDDLDEEDDSVVDNLPEFPKNYNLRKTRHSVSAEVYGEWNKKKKFVPPVYEKTPEQETRIKTVLLTCFMFQHLEADDLRAVLLAFTEKRITKGTVLIRQGDDGDSLYLIEKGEVDVFKLLPGETEPKHMCVMTPGDAVGELALLYNCPRAATVIAKDDEVVLWALDRGSFNHIVRSAAARRRELYESFLKEVEILKDMDPYERSKLSDALKSVTFQPGEVIIREGELGDTFYIIESGEAVALKGNEEVMKYQRGDYFGELALMKNQPRAATVKCTDGEVRCVSLDRRSFKRLLGPIEMILKRNAKRYEEVCSTLKKNSAAGNSCLAAHFLK